MTFAVRLAFIFATVGAGLVSRRVAFLPKSLGDVLWATLVFWLMGFVFPRRPVRFVALAAMAFAVGIEVLKFVEAPWLEAIRHRPGARLVFGYVFSWSNLVCYAVGIALGAAIQVAMYRSTSGEPSAGAQAANSLSVEGSQGPGLTS